MKPDLYDLVVIDEASQMYMSDAIPILYRAKSVVISGDNMQMPPSAAIPGERKSGGAGRSWPEEFLRLSGCTVEQEPVHCVHAPLTEVNV
jgi:hypothetical protein